MSTRDCEVMAEPVVATDEPVTNGDSDAGVRTTTVIMASFPLRGNVSVSCDWIEVASKVIVTNGDEKDEEVTLMTGLSWLVVGTCVSLAEDDSTEAPGARIVCKMLTCVADEVCAVVGCAI